MSAGLDCKFVTGTAKGGERYKYYLSETLWSDHTIEESKDLADDRKYSWEHHYLTGKDY